MWFVTRGGQIVERENTGELSGSVLWGLGKVVALEAAHLQPRMLDLDPGAMASLSDLANELLYPDQENHVAYRLDRRWAARLVRAAAAAEETGRIAPPEEPEWVLVPNRDGVFDRPEAKLLPAQTPGTLGGSSCCRGCRYQLLGRFPVAWLYRRRRPGPVRCAAM